MQRINVKLSSLVVTVVLVCAACGSESTPDRTTNPADGPNASQQDDPTSASPTSSQDPGEKVTGRACIGMTCGAGERCLDGQCVSATTAACKGATELGSLQAGEPLRISGSFGAGADDVLETACAGTESAPEKVYTFDVPAASRVDVSTNIRGAWDAKLEFRKGDCTSGNDADDGGICMDTDRSFFAPKKSTWFLIVEHDVGPPGDFTIDLKAKKSAVSQAVGTYGCEKGDRYLVEQFDGKVQKKRFDCPAGCSSGDCRGDTCSNPIVVDGQKGVSYKGELAAFTPKLNFEEGNKTCVVDGVQAVSLGSEVIFKVEDVEKGQTIDVDTTGDRHDNLVYFTNNCRTEPAEFACAGTGGNNASFEAPDDGDYWVVVDKFSNAAGKFEYEISVD